MLRAETGDGATRIGYRQLILATGARELFLPFPGWTLPNVTGVGGMQALVKAGLPVKGKRIVVAGSGPLLLAVAAYLRKAGATVPAIVEQAGWRDLTRFGMSLAASPAKILQAASLRLALASTPYWTDSWVTAAEGSRHLRTAHIQRNGGLQTTECDYLAISYGLVPNTELAALLGCSLRNDSVAVDEFQRTDSAGVFCAGEATGIGGVELSLVEGEIAGFSAALLPLSTERSRREPNSDPCPNPARWPAAAKTCRSPG
jgi:NADPH-dependent 2,4-dienoyl-CoA reductase/sulfur reductase-like enzyme